jgi:beta-lactamase regulating signal transducer with metallopeptidase domain
MNDLIIPLCWSALQVSCLALAGLLLSVALARRAPATAAFLTALTLAVCCALTVLAFAPLPDWWTWVPRAPLPESRVVLQHESPPVAPRQEDETAPPTVPSSPSTGIALHWPRFPAPPSAVRDEAPPGSRWPSLVAGVFLVGVAVGVGRLLLGLWALRRLVKRTQPIADRSLLDLVDGLRVDLGRTRPVGLRECPELASAATVGWLRPLILLPSAWTQWDEQERRAVLAHELAHVARHDCLAWLLARFSLVLHFYHPLVYWLVNRLHLQQELAADAFGVRCVGGSNSYLRVLARMALRQDDRSCAGPVRAFLSSPGTLLKRITMLKARDGVSSVSAPRGVRALGWMVLVLTALGASTLRSPAARQDPQRPTNDSATTSAAPAESGPDAAQADVAPFDMTYLAPDADVYFAVRPAALLSRPDMKSCRDQMNQVLDSLPALIGKKSTSWDLHIEDLEQAVGSMQVQLVPPTKPDEPTRHAVICNSFALRTTQEHDWKKTLSLLESYLEEEQLEGRTCYHLLPGKFAEPIGPYGPDLYCYLADKRTLVCGSKDGLRDLLRNGRKNALPAALAAQWKHVERYTAAVAINNIRKTMEGRKPEAENEFPIIPLLQVSKGLVAGADVNDSLRCQMIVQAATETDAANIVAETRRQMKLGLELGRKPVEKTTTNKEEATAIFNRVLTEVCSGYTIERDGTMVHWRGGAGVNALEVLTAVAILPEQGQKDKAGPK